jgi:hypothetical protein
MTYAHGPGPAGHLDDVREVRSGEPDHAAARPGLTGTQADSKGAMRLPELVGGAGGLGWVAAKAVLVFAVAVIGLRLGERRTLAQLGAFDFAVAVATGAIIGGTAISPSVSLLSGAVALVTLLVAHRLVASARRHSRIARMIDHPPRVSAV